MNADFRLRILVNAWTLGGHIKIDSFSKLGAKARKFDLATGLDYAHFALKKTIEQGAGRASWPVERDAMTRSKTVMHQRV